MGDYPVKDLTRQRQGAISRAMGKKFEDRLDCSFKYYREKGFAIIEKTPEPMHPIKDLGGGRFIANYEKKAQPDYKGTIKGGRSVMFEAKFTSADRMEQSRVTEGQSDYLEIHHLLGARCYIVAGFATGGVYRLPWEVWRDMKTRFGRKYVTEADLADYRVHLSWNNVLLLLD